MKTTIATTPRNAAAAMMHLTIAPAMTANVSYPKLSSEQKQKVADRLEMRKQIYIDAMTNAFTKHTGKILLIGDRPGPSAPTDPDYHHTPFYSTKHCSGWLNAALELANVPEEELVWLNSADRLGNPTYEEMLIRLRPSSVICLGGNAEKWMKQANKLLQFDFPYGRYDHPQYHKRFKNSEDYQLITDLREQFHPPDYF